MAHQTCCYCCADLGEGGGGPASLACGHTFHEDCIKEHLLRTRMHDRRQLRCPHCRMSANELSQLEAALLDPAWLLLNVAHGLRGEVSIFKLWIHSKSGSAMAFQSGSATVK